MTTNHSEHALRHLTNRVMAVIDDVRNAHAVVEALRRAGIREREFVTFSGDEGVRQVDAEGSHAGGMTQVVRGLQRWTVEGAHLRRYEAELGGGHHVVDVRVHGRRNRDAVVQILRRYGAHFINAYGQWTIEGMAA